MFKNGRIVPNQTIRIDVRFTDEDGDAFDPVNVAFLLINPCGLTTTYRYGADLEIDRTAEGSYSAEVTPTQAGRWSYRWQGGASSTSPASEDSFIVLTSPFIDNCCRDYC